MNDIWTNENSALDYYGEFLKELISKSYLLVIESYLLKSMASININLANKYKVLYLLMHFFNITFCNIWLYIVKFKF